jgi:uncharacterized protein YcfL
MGRLSKIWILPVLAAGWLVWAGGCSGPSRGTVASPSPPTGRPPQNAAASEDKRFVIAPELEQILRVISVRLINPPGAYLKIQVNVQNITDKRQKFNYRIEWFDADGARMPVEAEEPSPWMLRPHEESSIVATAPTPAAADFGIAFVPADN